MKSKFSLILDFDSTIISVETLDYLADISTKNIIKKNKLIDKISHYTDLAMNGDITFQESLEIRLKLMQINKDDIDSSIELIQKKIDSSFIDNIHYHIIKPYSDIEVLIKIVFVCRKAWKYCGCVARSIFLPATAFPTSFGIQH